MLRSFRLGNHRSFRGEQELLLMPSYDKDTLAVPVAAIYGANASGKSNLIDGLRFMASAVRDSFARWDADSGVPRRPFRLDSTARAEPSTFVVELVIADVRYIYGFAVDDSKVLEEWLYSYPEKRKRVMFEREHDEVKFGSTVPELRAKLEVLAGLLRPNALFLSLVGQSNVYTLLHVYRWFLRDLTFLCLDSVRTVDDVAGFVRSGQASRDRIVDLLRVADLGISDLEVAADLRAEAQSEFDDAQKVLANLRNEIDVVSHKYSRQHSEGEGRDLVRRAAKIEEEYNVAIVRFARARDRLDLVHQEESGVVRLVHGAAGEAFDLAEESAGTRSWLAMLPTVLTTLHEGGTLVVDEIDTSLHPVLVLRLVKLFHDNQTNLAGAQLIFTTHDATLLHPPLAEEALARDEIWFVEKDRAGTSILYPLTDFKPRAEDNLERRYLAGKYGAIPNVLEEDFIAAIRGGVDGET